MAWVKDYHADVLTSLLEIQEKFADLDIILLDGTVRANRCAVASLSKAFFLMLSTDMAEHNEGKLTLPAVSQDDWSCILNFYFSGGDVVTHDNVEELLSIAHMYQLHGLFGHCSPLMVEGLTVENCLDRVCVSQLLLPSAAPTIMDFIKKNFSQVVQRSEFCSLPKEVIQDLLRSCGVVATEELLCDAVLKWLSAQESILREIEELLSLVKFYELPSTYVCPLVPNEENKAIIRVFEEERRKWGPREQRQKQSVAGQNVAQIRNPKGEGQEIIVVGHTVGYTVRVLCIGEDRRKWTQLTSVEVGQRAAVHMIEDTLFITGGLHTESVTYKYNIKTQVWSKGPCLIEMRTEHAMASVGNTVYVLGGVGRLDHDYLTSVEKWRTDRDTTWEKSGKLGCSTWRPAAAVVGNIIVVVGGSVDDNHVQTFDVLTNTCQVFHRSLPAALVAAKGVSDGDGAIFVGNDGEMVRICLSDGGVSVTSPIRLPDLKFQWYFGLVMDGDHVIWLADGSRHQQDYGISRYSLRDGHEDTGFLPSLPLPFQVLAAFAYKGSTQGRNNTGDWK